MVDIREVKNRRDLKRFVEFPFRIYRDVAQWVPPLSFDEMNTLNKSRNPAFEFCRSRCWLAYKDGRIAGRIAGIINDKYIKDSGNKYARFGWIDFIDDEEVSSALLGAVESWAKDNNLEAVHGPLGFCDLDKEGMLIEGYDELDMFITIYNHPYYPLHLERLGYGKDTDWLEFLIDIPDRIPERIEKLNRLIIKKYDLKIVKFKKRKKLLPYVKAIFEQLNREYRNLYGFVALSEKQIEWYTKQYFSFINPEYVRLVLDQKDELIAFGIAIPSLALASKRSSGKLFPLGFIRLLRAMGKNDRLELLLVAVRSDYHGKGVNVLLLNDINISAINNDMRYAETGPELETNRDVQSLWKYYDVRQHRRRRCYIKNIQE